MKNVVRAHSVFLGVLIVIFALACAARADSMPETHADTAGKWAEPKLLPAASKPNLEWVLAVPANWSSSVIRSSTDSLAASAPDVHLAPELALKWYEQFEHVKASISLGVFGDRYKTAPNVSESQLFATATLAITDGKSETFVPFVSVSEFHNLEWSMRRQNSALTDLVGGVFSGHGFRNGQDIAFSDAKKAGDVSVALTLRTGRRLADPKEQTNTFAQASVEVQYVWSDAIAVSVTPRVTARWFDDFLGEDREDQLFGTSLKLVWTPDWLKKAFPTGRIDWTAQWLRNVSTVGSEKFEDLTIGPTLVIGAAL